MSKQWQIGTKSDGTMPNNAVWIEKDCRDSCTTAVARYNDYSFACMCYRFKLDGSSDILCCDTLCAVARTGIFIGAGPIIPTLFVAADEKSDALKAPFDPIGVLLQPVPDLFCSDLRKSTLSFYDLKELLQIPHQLKATGVVAQALTPNDFVKYRSRWQLRCADRLAVAGTAAHFDPGPFGPWLAVSNKWRASSVLTSNAQAQHACTTYAILACIATAAAPEIDPTSTQAVYDAAANLGYALDMADWVKTWDLFNDDWITSAERLSADC